MSVIVKDGIEVNPENAWRLDTPGDAGWERTARPRTAKKKYFMVSVDTHLTPPFHLFGERIDAKFRDLLPRIEVRDGARWMVQHGLRAEKLVEPVLQGEDLLRTKAGAGLSSIEEFSPIEKRVRDQDLDGVDAEVIFPNGPALLMWAGGNPEFSMAQAQVWNDWSLEFCRPYRHRCYPAAAVPTADIDAAIAEVERVAKAGARVLTLPNKPIWGPDDVSNPNYNLPIYDRFWAAVVDHELPITFHVASGKDPRAARGNGGAISNYVVHALAPTLEPVVALCGSGVLERFPRLRFATIEANAGWLPWTLDMMDEAYLKHHFWVRPKLKHLPSEYFRMNGAASIGEDRSALLTAGPYRLEDNLMWANDFPHHEGSWPHSAEAIERLFGTLGEDTRAKMLGLNAARFFGFDIPDHLR
jgi:predicted TIM-barrel fold metal-dependent hydrolase